jgi:hypothetical protein
MQWFFFAASASHVALFCNTTLYFLAANQLFLSISNYMLIKLSSDLYLLLTERQYAKEASHFKKNGWEALNLCRNLEDLSLRKRERGGWLSAASP